MQKRVHPPRSLLAAILFVTVLPLAFLLWLGWRFLDHDRILERRQAQDRLDRSADLVVAAVQRGVSASEQRLAAGAADWPEGAVSLEIAPGRIESRPRQRLAYLPIVPPRAEAPPEAFAEGEALEFRQRDRASAIRKYLELTASGDPSVRAGALLRLARNLKAAGRTGDALAAYDRLTNEDASIAGAPASLVARYARCKLFDETGRRKELRTEAQKLADDLHAGRWTLTGPLYWLYASDADTWTGKNAGALPSETLAKAAEALAAKWDRLADAGRDVLRVDGQLVTVLWSRSGDSGRALLADTSFVERDWLGAAAEVARQQNVGIAFDRASAERHAIRSAAESGLPWALSVWSLTPAEDQAFVQRRRLLLAGFALVALLALTAGYLIYRAVSREFAVARLQSDFVAAVSHEFRTPLTALRQFTDMLRDGAAASDERRRLCYDAQARATDRLTRLVESLLDFGRMEAGSRPYRFEPCDCAALTRRTVEEFRAEPQATGFDIDVSTEVPAAEIDADPEALSRAVGNLLENAVKYSPDSRAVRVAVTRRNASIAISVCDRGIGIPSGEQRRIFGQFQRGEQARKLGIRGTGVGLAMVDHIVRAHRGRVEVESEPGKGSTFTLVLPARINP